MVRMITFTSGNIFLDSLDSLYGVDLHPEKSVFNCSFNSSTFPLQNIKYNRFQTPPIEIPEIIYASHGTNGFEIPSKITFSYSLSGSELEEKSLRGSRLNSYSVNTTLYNPGRKILRKLYDLVNEGLNKIYKLHLSRIPDRVRGSRLYKWMSLRNGETLKKGLNDVIIVTGLGSLVSLALSFPRVERRIGASITRWGLPFSWLEKCVKVYPNSPTSYSPTPQNFIINTIIWSSLLAVVLSTYKLRKWYKSREKS